MRDQLIKKFRSLVCAGPNKPRGPAHAAGIFLPIGEMQAKLSPYRTCAVFIPHTKQIVPQFPGN